MTVRMRHALECRRDDPPWLLVNAALVRFKDGLRFALAARSPSGWSRNSSTRFVEISG